MEAATWGRNAWTGSWVSLFLEDFGPQTTNGFLIEGGRVEITDAKSSKRFVPYDEWGDQPDDAGPGGQGVHEQLIGSIRMWNRGLGEWGMGKIYLHLRPFARPSSSSRSPALL